MINEVKIFIQKHELLHRNSTVIIGVSGGPDSMALLHFMKSIQKQWGLRLIAVTVDHGLRGIESQQDGEYVSEICSKWGIEFHGTYLDVGTYKKAEGIGTQLAARKLRYQFYEQQMEQYQADYLALGHHGDDQMETMMMRLVRGSNPSALTGIPTKRPIADGYLIRPFLGVTKQMIETYCKESGIVPRRDPSNEEDIYTRNYFRIHIMPLLKKMNPNLAKGMQRLSEVITSDEDFLNKQAENVVAKVVKFAREPLEASLGLQEFLYYPYALQRRAFHLILNYLYHTLPEGLSSVHEDYFFDLIHNERANVTIDLPMDLKVSKSYQQIKFHFNEQEPTAFHYYLDVPGSIQLPGGSTITSSLSSNTDDNSKYVMVCPCNEVSFPLIVRNRKPGDRMRLKGLNGRKKVKDIFIDEKVPLHLREKCPVIEDNEGNIIWLVGIRKGIVEEKPKGRSFLQLQFKPGNV